MGASSVSAMSASHSMSAHVAEIEGQLVVLEAAFASGDGLTIEQQCLQLQRSLADSLVAFRKAEQQGIDPLSADLRQRLKLAQARIHAQQLAVSRANTSIDRTMRVLFPTEDSSTYGALGHGSSNKVAKAYR